MNALADASTEQLEQAIAKGQRMLTALQMGNLADLRLADMSEGSDRVLDRNFEQIRRAETALRNARAELVRRKGEAA